MLLATPLFLNRTPVAAVVAAVAVARARAWLVWWLIGTLLLYSASASVLRVLGPRHWHATPAVAPSVDRSSPLELPVPWRGMADQVRQQAAALIARLQDLSDQAHARAHALGAAPHHHAHGGVQRHWHATGDDTVRLDAGAGADPALDELKTVAAIGGALLLPLPAAASAWPAAQDGNGRWPAGHAQAWRSAPQAPPLKPPQA